ncbi:MAG TPA: hypothetical protein VLK23_14780 [Thermodesulfobacteriota bacterium]|nr:hypothetical protein [Thermodesulfobacteriota bacterium]
MKKVALVLISLFFITASFGFGADQDLVIQGKTLVSKKPPFTLMLPSELQWIDSSSIEHPAENSITRTAIFIREKAKQVEEMLIVQIADKTNPQAGPMVVPPLKPYNVKRMYIKDKIKRGEGEVDYLTQLMAWNPEAPSLQPIVKKGVRIPSHWALQYQLLFQPQLEHAVFFRYSKDIHSFGLKVSDEGKSWDKESISGDERKVYEIFQKMISGMIESLSLKNP